MPSWGEMETEIVFFFSSSCSSVHSWDSGGPLIYEIVAYVTAESLYGWSHHVQERNHAAVAGILAQHTLALGIFRFWDVLFGSFLESLTFCCMFSVFISLRLFLSPSLCVSFCLSLCLCCCLSLCLTLSLFPCSVCVCVSLSLWLPRWRNGKASPSRAEDPGFESRLRRDFFWVESYQWLKNWLSSGYPARRLAL